MPAAGPTALTLRRALRARSPRAVQVSGEVEHLQRAAEGFATSMLVEAIATSQGQYGVRPHQHDTVRARLRQAAAEQEVRAAPLGLCSSGV